jgi:hypothetical protein
MNISFDFRFGFSTISISKTSNLDIAYDKYSYPPNHQGEDYNGLDI